jgi:hypothetical protein
MKGRAAAQYFDLKPSQDILDAFSRHSLVLRHDVSPAEAGAQSSNSTEYSGAQDWIRAFAGMTNEGSRRRAGLDTRIRGYDE